MIRNLFLAALFVSTIAAANYATTEFGLISAGFGLMVLAGTYMAGLALGLRDALQESGGKWWTVGAIIAGTLLSFALADPMIAAASGVAFGLSEFADLLVYTPLRKKGFRRAVIASGAVGALVDTLLFLWIAGFPITGEIVAGQLLVKAVWCTVGFLLVAEVLRRALSREPKYATDSSSDEAR